MRIRGLSPEVRGHFRRDGRAKKKFGTRLGAERAAIRHHKLAYYCEFCGCYHIGGVR